MKRLFALSVLLLLALVSLPTLAWNRSPATTFAALPGGATTPEGITVDGSGNVYVSTFGFPESGSSSEPGRIVVFDSHGKLLRQLIVSGASPHLLGLGVNPTTGQLLVADFGAGKVLSVDPSSGTSQLFTDIGPTSGLNALAFDSAGNVYISDSFQSTIWRTGPGGGTAIVWATDPLLGTKGVPPFGANGLAFNSSGTLLVANTGDDSVVQIPVSGGTAGKASILAYSINGADGLIVDANDNIWVAANQSDEIVVLDPTGKVIAKLGDFNGIDPNGAARGLLFPASLVFSGEFVLVTNLALDLAMPGFGFPTVDSQWAAQVTRYTVSKISRHLPPIQAGKH